MTNIMVRGFHLDGFSHVNNARFLEFLEEARWDYFGDFLRSDYLRQNNLIFMVINININYRRAALLGQLLQIDCKLKSINNRTFTVDQIISLKDTDTIIADAQVISALVNTETNRSVTIDENLRKQLGSFGEKHE